MNAPAPAPTTGTPSNGRRPRSGTVRRVITWVIGLAILAGIAQGFRSKPVEVEITTASVGPLTVTVLEEGKTRIRHRYVVSPPIAGRLERIPLRAGDKLEAGKTVLATIEPTPAAFLDPRSKAEAEARVKAARAAIELRTAQLERARDSLDWATKEKSRADVLRKQNTLSAREWDQAQNQLAVQTRELHAAEFSRQMAEFELAQAEAAARQASDPGSEKTEPLVIKAPINGFVLNVYEESSRIVTPGMPLLEVGDPTDLEAEIELLSSDAVAVAPGAEVSIEKWGGEQPLKGRVSVVEPGAYTKVSALGVEEQRVKVRVDFVDPLPSARPLGDRYRVEARIVVWQSEGVLQVPTGALFRKGNDWMTFLFEKGQAHPAKVVINHSNGLSAEVKSGLTAGQQVLLHPPDTVADGTAIKPRVEP